MLDHLTEVEIVEEQCKSNGKLADNLCCERNNGTLWRCKKRKAEGQRLCLYSPLGMGFSAWKKKPHNSQESELVDRVAEKPPSKIESKEVKFKGMYGREKRTRGSAKRSEDLTEEEMTRRRGRRILQRETQDDVGIGLLHGRGEDEEETRCTPGVCENAAEKNDGFGGSKEVSNGKEMDPIVDEESMSIEHVEDEVEGEEEGIEEGLGKGTTSACENVSEKNVGYVEDEGGNEKEEDVQEIREGDDEVEEDGGHKVEKCTSGVCENAKVGELSWKESASVMGTESAYSSCNEMRKPKRRGSLVDENGILIGSMMCHQCQRNDKGEVIRCTKCKTRRFCKPCIQNWYPKMKEGDIAHACPVCRSNCNCRACLRLYGAIRGQLKQYLNISIEKKIEHSKYLLRKMLPFLKQFNKEQLLEKEMEAKIKGVSASEIKLPRKLSSKNDRTCCNNCRASIVDFHRSCPKCKYDLCLTCCQEFRAGQLEEANLESVKRLVESKRNAKPRRTARRTCHDVELVNQANGKPEWKADKKGTIPCPPAEFGGCNAGHLKLKSICLDGQVSELLRKAEQIAVDWGLENLSQAPSNGCCSCSNSTIDDNIGTERNLLKCACRDREGSDDNSLYCPDARDLQHGDLKHFQWHWARGEPIIVRHVLETTSGLSWEPLVMWRAFRQIKSTKHSTLDDFKVIDCSNLTEASVNLHQFFDGYSKGRFDRWEAPILLKLENSSPAGDLEARSPRHAVEFICALPFKEYTHPSNGTLNLPAKLQYSTGRTGLGPKIFIAYGYPQELGCRDSVTMLHSEISDTVNIMTHIREVPEIGKHKVKVREDPDKCRENEASAHAYGSVLSEHYGGGSLWDIFRREDVPKLEEYLRKHDLELRDIQHFQSKKTIHPIHDQTFYLTEAHKRKLKEEFGIKAWTFVQKLGEAVFIPAGCPYQVRNLSPCINVALGFVSPENLHECIRLAGEFRSLPHDHRAKEDKLMVKEMIFFAVKRVVEDLEQHPEFNLDQN